MSSPTCCIFWFPLFFPPTYLYVLVFFFPAKASPYVWGRLTVHVWKWGTKKLSGNLCVWQPSLLAAVCFFGGILHLSPRWSNSPVWVGKQAGSLSSEWALSQCLLKHWRKKEHFPSTPVPPPTLLRPSSAWCPGVSLSDSVCLETFLPRFCRRRKNSSFHSLFIFFSNLAFYPFSWFVLTLF